MALDKDQRYELRLLMLKKGIKVNEVATHTARSSTLISRYLSGKCNVSYEVEKKISDFVKSK